MRILRTLLSVTLLFVATTALAEDGFESLFDGKSMDGWKGKAEFWSVEDGALTGTTTPENPTKGNTFLIYQGDDVADFELRLKFKIEGGNSGIQYRSVHLGDSVVSGYQADIDAAGKWVGILYEEKGRGILAKRGEHVKVDSDGKKSVIAKTAAEAEIAASIKKDDWNEYVLIAKGNELTQKLNGLVTIKLTDEQEDKRKASGILALQLHQGPPMKVQFKDIQLKRLK